MPQIYKKKQGLLVRWCTFACAAALMLFGAYSFHLYLPQMLSLDPGIGLNRDLVDPINIPFVNYVIFVTPRWLISNGLAVVFVAVAGYLCFLHQALGDFLIDTESEMRKVSWPTLQKVVTSSIVVIITIFMLGLFIYLIDIGLYHGFDRIFHSKGSNGRAK